VAEGYAEPLDRIRAAMASGEYLITWHLSRRLRERDIDLAGVRRALAFDMPEVIEDYPADPRGASSLVLCCDESGVWYHTVCGHEDVVRLITVYVPDPAQWSHGLRVRK
jgi:hypothetical protein